MKREIIGHLTACLMALSLLLVACAPAPTTQPTPTTTSKPTAPATVASPTPTDKPVAAPAVEKPKYGGVLRIGRTADIIDFDGVVGVVYRASTFMVTNEPLFSGDWAKGPAGGYGSNETTWDQLLDIWPHKAGVVAESWEIPNKIEGDTGTMVWHIRKGVRWALNPDSEASRLVNGRELTADDVVFTLKTSVTDARAYLYRSNPELRTAKITAPDKWTVKIELPWDTFATGVTRFGDYSPIVPPEVLEKWGLDAMKDWKKSVGTGPFMLTDFVRASSATLVRNPNYWMKDPVGPGKGNQLPYLDGVKLLIVPDKSTLYAGVRTGKIDWVTAIMPEDLSEFNKTTPQLKSHQYSVSTAGNAIGMRTDKPPFNDIRVRRALMMGIDFERIKRDYFKGNAQILTWPIQYYKEFADAYLGLDDPEMSASVRELYIYNPDKAKALLKEAGYPNGFKTWLNFQNLPEQIDYFSIYKEMWAKIGVEVELRPLELASHTAMKNGKTHEQLLTGIGAPSIAGFYKLINLRGERSADNVSMINNSVVEDYFPRIQRAVVTDTREANRLHKELMKYVLDQAWAIPAVVPPEYTLWWPWLKNYNGEVNIGYIRRHFYNWVWIDEALKNSMGY
ncbi:MAG: ABC transporter substrate-binding protein [Chloroflexi bacterium]|nr:ABC transporter substrate-binding protein [Chloroflexota bacterium]